MTLITCSSFHNVTLPKRDSEDAERLGTLHVNKRASESLGCSGDKWVMKDSASAQEKSTEASKIFESQTEGTRGAVEILMNC